MVSQRNERGVALVTVLMMIALVGGLLGSAYLLTSMERSAQSSSMAATRGFYAAEAGLNVRAAAIRREFDGYRRPAGVSPPLTRGEIPCGERESSDDELGRGDFACRVDRFADRDVRSYVIESPANPRSIRIPPGELYQNLYAQEYGYAVSSVAVDRRGRPEAILDMEFKSRLIPLFQFAAFYNKDLEILPGPPMDLAGPVHANGDLYLGAIDSLTISGQVTSTGRMFHGRKNEDSCQGGAVRVYDPATPADVPACGPGRVELTSADVSGWQGMIRPRAEPLVVPEPESIDAAPGRLYWDRADMRIVLDMHDSPPSIEIRRPDGTPDLAAGDFLVNSCGTAARSNRNALRNKRENVDVDLLDIDVEALLDCIDANPALQNGRRLNDGSDGGLVWHLSVDGPDDVGVNDYGVRLRNGERLASSRGDAPEIRGLTVVSDQALYVQGDYNAEAWKPAALMADSLNVLSNAWLDARSGGALPARAATATEIHAAFLAGTDTTGVDPGTNLPEGMSRQDLGNYNGGLENYPRFHETWSGVTLTYRGSFVSLGRPRHVDGSWDDQEYVPPRRDWRFELRFNDAALLPPLSPRAVFLEQELFERSFEY